jgi:16S rRNA (uracil1498-N3)-methyltransferase
MPRFYCPFPLSSGTELDLPPNAARHVQVLRMQPGQKVTLFCGAAAAPQGAGEFDARIIRMGRTDVRVAVEAHHSVEREARRAVHLAMGMPANERMDWLVEKATELGVASISPLVTARTVLRLKGDRAEKKRAHWEAIAAAACEQCGRNRIPVVHAPVDFETWMHAQPTLATTDGTRLVLSLREPSHALRDTAEGGAPALALIGPEGGLTEQEEDQAVTQGFVPVGLGARVLRAETAALAVLATLAG